MQSNTAQIIIITAFKYAILVPTKKSFKETHGKS